MGEAFTAQNAHRSIPKWPENMVSLYAIHALLRHSCTDTVNVRVSRSVSVKTEKRNYHYRQVFQKGMQPACFLMMGPPYKKKIKDGQLGRF